MQFVNPSLAHQRHGVNLSPPPVFFWVPLLCSTGTTTQLKTGADEHELFRHVMQSFQDFEDGTFARLAEILSAVDPEKPGDAEAPPASEDLGGLPADYTDIPPMDVVSEALASAWTEGRVAQFEHLDEALDR